MTTLPEAMGEVTMRKALRFALVAIGCVAFAGFAIGMAWQMVVVIPWLYFTRFYNFATSAFTEFDGTLWAWAKAAGVVGGATFVFLLAVGMVMEGWEHRRQTRRR